MAAPSQSSKLKPAPSRKPAAAAPSSKKPVNQEELRRLMREKQRQSAAKKRIDSPFAKYNSLGNVSCSLCNAPIKTELLWQTHVLGKQHKEKVAELKGIKPAVPGPVPVFAASSSSFSCDTKRKGPDLESHDVKKVKAASKNKEQASELPTDFFDNKGHASQILKPLKGPSLLAAYYDDNDDNEEEAEKQAVKEISESSSIVPCSAPKTTDRPAPTEMVLDASLPADFFDSERSTTTKVSHSGSILKAEFQEKAVERKENTAEALPEGFFDDPEVDAKVRKVDAPKDQMDKEWEEFQKEMRQVNTVSEAIVAEEDEEGRIDRQIEEIDDQMECYRRIEMLRNRQDLLKDAFLNAMRSRASQEQEDQDSGSDDGELQVLLSQDWRVKGALM